MEFKKKKSYIITFAFAPWLPFKWVLFIRHIRARNQYKEVEILKLLISLQVSAIQYLCFEEDIALAQSGSSLLSKRVSVSPVDKAERAS